jgi:hypothetical protein
MFRKKDEEKPAPAGPPKDEHAYEDNWYRSLKALSAQADDEGEDTLEHPGSTPADEPDQAPIEVEVPSATELSVPDEAVFDETPTEDEAPAPAPQEEAVQEEELETRANQLLERLRTLQHLGDPGSDDEASEGSSSESTPSVWG